MNKVNRYIVTNYPNKVSSRWGKFLLFLGLRKHPATFDIWINAEFKKGDVMETGSGTFQIIKKY